MKRFLIGFSLIEILIALAVVSILSAVAYPSYQSYMAKNRRSDGQIALLDLANRMERYFTNNNTYVGATLANVGIASASPGGYYTLTIATATTNTYSLQATPSGAQASDTTCATLTLNQLGQKGATGSGTAANCWQ